MKLPITFITNYTNIYTYKSNKLIFSANPKTVLHLYREVL